MAIDGSNATLYFIVYFELAFKLIFWQIEYLSYETVSATLEETGQYGTAIVFIYIVVDIEPNNDALCLIQQEVLLSR